MGNSKIEWTEKTWNPVTGCNKVSPGCKNCYAETIANRFWGNRKFTDVICHGDRLEQPLHWKKPAMIFVNSMSDLFHEKIPFEFMRKIFITMYNTPNHTYQVLTKRIERALEFNLWLKQNEDLEIKEFVNLWLGTSIENQEQTKRLNLDFPFKIWVSFEPLLSSIVLTKEQLNKLFWVVVGSESGSKSRPMQIEWAESLLQQCKQANTPFFMKQIVINHYKIPYDSFPENLKVREYPNA